MTISRQDFTSLWICHWFYKNTRKEGSFTDCEFTHKDPEKRLLTLTRDELKNSILKGEARLVASNPQFFENLLAEAESREPRNFYIEFQDDTVDEEEAYTAGDKVWLCSGSPRMTI